MYKINSLINTDIEVAAYQKRLSICLRSDGFSFWTVKLPTVQQGVLTAEQLLSSGDITLELKGSIVELSSGIKSALSDAGVDPFAFKSIELILPSSHFVWIPSHLFQYGQERQYLAFLEDSRSNALYGTMGYYNCESQVLGSTLVFAANSTVVTAMKIALPGVQITSPACKLVDAGLLQRSATHPLILMYVEQGQVLYSAFKNGQLQISTSKPFSQQSELLYGTLELMKDIDFENDSLELLICGQVDRQVYALLRNYFPVVDLYCGPVRQLGTPELQHRPAYQYPF